jgi:hypothetical protein
MSGWRKRQIQEKQMPMEIHEDKIVMRAGKYELNIKDDYERGFIDGMQKQMQSSVDKAVNEMSRIWLGLTNEEIDQGLLRSDYALKTAEAWRAGVVFAMTQLKEKNT